jgi:hypothetical protein
MKNGYCPGGAPARTVGPRHVFALVLAGACTFVFLPALASNPEPARCDTRVLDTPWNERWGQIPSPTNLQECL